MSEPTATTGNAIGLSDATEPYGPRATGEPNHRLRLLIVMARGLAGPLPEAWRSYARIEDARASALVALRNPLVPRVAIVEDGLGSTGPLRFVEWVGWHDNHRNMGDA